MGHRGVAVIVSALLLGVAVTAAAQPQTVPPPAGLGPDAPATSLWQAFVAYRDTLRWMGGVVLAVALALVLAHLAAFGVHRVRPTGRLVRRYGASEVVLHAVLAVAFVAAWISATWMILAARALGYAVAGVPVPGARLTNAVHLAGGLLFLACLAALGVRWRPAMRFASYDVAWLTALGGYLSRSHRVLPAGRFNAGQKVWFRVSLVSGGLVGLSGALLYVPALLGASGGVVLYVVHTAAGVLLTAAVLVHAYLAVVLHPRAARAIVTGTVDEACERQDHPIAA